MAKFTFKKHRETGLRAVCYRPYSDIKIGGIVVGYIKEGRVNFKVKKEATASEPAPFRWITIKKEFGSDEEAREFLRGVGVDALLKAHDIFFDERDR